MLLIQLAVGVGGKIGVIIRDSIDLPASPQSSDIVRQLQADRSLFCSYLKLLLLPRCIVPEMSKGILQIIGPIRVDVVHNKTLAYCGRSVLNCRVQWFNA